MPDSWLAHQEGMFSGGIERKVSIPWFSVGLCNVRVERNSAILCAEKGTEQTWAFLFDAVCAVGIVKIMST